MEVHSKPPPPELRAPRLPGDYAQRVAALTQNIYERGVAVERDKLLLLGKQRFRELLATERVARSERAIGTRCDLTSFASVLFALSQQGALHSLPVPVPSMHQQLCGQDAELDQARKIECFVDLWKLYGAEPRAVRAVYAFHDQFVELVFGQSLLTWVEDNGRVYHKFFAHGSGDKASYFEAWMPALKGTHYRVKITDALPAIIFWLAGEQSPPPTAHELAQECFGVRLPSPLQITFAHALFEGFLLSQKGGHCGSTLAAPRARCRTNPSSKVTASNCANVTARLACSTSKLQRRSSNRLAIIASLNQHGIASSLT